MKRSLYIVAESDIDLSFIQEVLDLSKYEVRAVGVNGRNTIASYVRMMRLMMNNTARMVVVFDSDVDSAEKTQKAIDSLRQASQTEYVQDKVGIFAFFPNLEGYFQMPKLRKSKDAYSQYAREHKDELVSKKLIQEIQTFLNK
jgi:hypothetical protein